MRARCDGKHVTMKQAIRRVAAFVLIGAAINIAVAWSCIAAARTSGSKPFAPALSDSRWALDAPAELPVQSGVPSFSNQHFGVSRMSWQVRLWREQPRNAGDVEKTAERSYTVNLVDCGWPMRSLWYRKFGLEPESPRPGGAMAWLRRGVWLTPDTPGVRMFPMVLAIAPLWGGFAVNSLLYGALVAVPVMLPGAVRRAVRRRRGQCEACAYPIGASAVCTECGKPIPAIALRSRHVGVRGTGHTSAAQDASSGERTA